MIKSRYMDIICIVCCAAAVLLTLFISNEEAVQVMAMERTYPYENKLFDDSRVHTIDIILDESDWENILSNPMDKEYVVAALIIDGEAYKNVGFRTKGNTSLSTVASMDSDRYSFKIEFDHYDSNTTYYGLDKITLNNIIQDSTYMKDYLSYHMFNEIGTASPLSSFTSITVNGEDFGLYLAVEAVEENFLLRTYGTDRGKLYKPDNMQIGGGTGGRRDDSGSLKYTDDDFESYTTLWDGAVFKITDSDKTRLIQSLKTLNEGEVLEEAIDVEGVLKYFVVHNFVLNFDSYTGNMLHNYYLYELDGILTMIPWDYNLAFGGFAMGGGRGGDSMGSTSTTDMVNFPIDTPLSGASFEDRPMIGKLFENEEYLTLYHQYFDEFIADYFESGRFETEYDRVVNLITEYVKDDPSAFVTYEEFLAGSSALKEFCLLRAESIRGQLEGAIPATSAGQQADSSQLINGEHISLSDMGSMGGFGGGFPQRGGEREENNDFSFSDFDGLPEGIPFSENGDGFSLAAFGGQKPQEVQNFDNLQIPGNEEFKDEGYFEKADLDGDWVENSENAQRETEKKPESSDTEANREEGEDLPPMTQGGGQGGMGDRPMFGGQGGGFGGNMEALDGTGSGSQMNMLYLLGGCALALVFGFVFVLRYRRF